MGPVTARDYVDSFYRQAYRSEILAGGTGTETAKRRPILTFCLNASAARQNLALVEGLTLPLTAAAAAAAIRRAAGRTRLPHG